MHIKVVVTINNETASNTLYRASEQRWMLQHKLFCVKPLPCRNQDWLSFSVSLTAKEILLATLCTNPRDASFEQRGIWYCSSTATEQYVYEVACISYFTWKSQCYFLKVDRYVQTAISVDHPSCPVVKNIIRAKVCLVLSFLAPTEQVWAWIFPV